MVATIDSGPIFIAESLSTRQLIISLVPSPTPSFSSLLSTVKRTASDEKLGVGLGTRLTNHAV